MTHSEQRKLRKPARAGRRRRASRLFGNKIAIPRHARASSGHRATSRGVIQLAPVTWGRRRRLKQFVRPNRGATHRHRSRRSSRSS